MEGFLTYYFEYHFLYITGIEHVESKSIQGASLMKLVFHNNTDMSAAMAEVVGYVNRARAFMPSGTVGPFITRFDAGRVPVAQLVFSSESKSAGELQDIALNRVRPLFATLEGVSAPPPFGGNQKTVIVRAQPEKLRQYRISPDQLIAAVNRASTVMPSGNLRAGDLNYIASTNAVLGAKLDDLLDAPVRPGVWLRSLPNAQRLLVRHQPPVGLCCPKRRIVMRHPARILQRHARRPALAQCSPVKLATGTPQPKRSGPEPPS